MIFWKDQTFTFIRIKINVYSRNTIPNLGYKKDEGAVESIAYVAGYGVSFLPSVADHQHQTGPQGDRPQNVMPVKIDLVNTIINV